MDVGHRSSKFIFQQNYFRFFFAFPREIKLKLRLSWQSLKQNGVTLKEIIFIFVQLVHWIDCPIQSGVNSEHSLMSERLIWWRFFFLCKSIHSVHLNIKHITKVTKIISEAILSGNNPVGGVLLQYSIWIY